MSAFDLELYLAIRLCIQGMVLTTTHLVSGVKFGAALADEDISGCYHFATEFLDPQSFRL